MAFNPEEFEMMLDDYGIVVSERTRRRIHRNIKKRKVQDVPVNRFIVWRILTCIVLFLKSIIYKFFSCILYLSALFIWLVLSIFQIMLEVYMAAVICYVVAEFIKQIGPSRHLQV